MPAVQYPFIDIAVHERVKERFARGEAIVLFSADIDRVLWANGAGARLFGNPAIYDFLEEGPNRSDVMFRQMEATARQLAGQGDSRQLLVRIAAGFQRLSVQASVELVRTPAGEAAILFAVPLRSKPATAVECAGQMLQGFDDPDTHMAVLGDDGGIIAASARFAGLGMTEHTAKALVTMVSNHPDRLMKRPIPTGRGYLPAAIGKLSDTPGLHLLFVVEMAIGNLDPTEDFSREAPQPIRPATAETETEAEHDHDRPAVTAEAEETGAGTPDPAEAAAIAPVALPVGDGDFAEILDAVVGIEAIDEIPGDDPDDRSFEIGDTAPAEDDAAPGDTDVTSGGETAGDDADAAQAEAPADDRTASGAATPDTDTDTDTDTDVDVDAESTLVPETAAPSSILADAGPPLPAIAAADAALVAIAGGAAQTADPAPGGFVFNANARATRFVWKIDAHGRFSEVSNEFAKAVGPHAASISGLAFTDIAHLFNLDPEGKITELLSKRDTWSGKTIHWPIEGTRLKVPVDLAALPTYTRNREFDGFRGFGIVRLADAVNDPLELGLTLLPHTTVRDAVSADGDAALAIPTRADDTDAVLPGDGTSPLPDDASEADGPADDGGTVADLSTGDQPAAAFGNGEQGLGAVSDAPPAPENDNQSRDDAADDAMRPSEQPMLNLPWGERPALRLVETPGRRSTDKVIQLEERRARGRDGLSPVEQAAFREIARQLEPLIQVPAAAAGKQPPADAADDATGHDAEPAAQTADGTGDDRQPAVLDGDAAAALRQDDGAAAPDGDVEPAAVADADAADDDETTTDTPAADPAQTDDQSAAARHVQASLEALSSLIPPRAKAGDGLSPGVIDMMPVALLVHAGDTLIHANPEFLRLSGYETLRELQEIGGLDALLQQEDLDATSEQPGGITLVRADDVLVPVMARLQSIRWEQTNALMLALMPVAGFHAPPVRVVDDAAAEVDADLKSERLVEKLAKLQGELEELRSILETATDGVVIIGHDGEIRSMNRSASALFNYDNDETTGRPFVMLFAHESQRSVVDYLGALSDNGVASVLNDGREVIGREASGGFIPLFMTMGRLTASDGYCAVIRDITQWKRTEEELRNAKRAAETANAHKSDFLARVSHEIRTPLNAIIGFSDMMATERLGAIGHPRYTEYANDIGRSGRHVLDIVNDLLDISKIEAGEMDLEFIAVGLNETISEAVSLVQPQANSQRVIIRTALSQAVPEVVADLRSIKQIALNILSNAIRFTPSGGQIVVSTSYETNGSVVLRIRDTGVGMTRSELEQAMKPFRQVTTGGRKRGDGTGLGLPLTKAMVDANRANFAINSAPNEGTLVEITFPSPRVLAN